MTNNYTWWLRWSIIIGLFATLFIPFVIANGSFGVPNMFFPFITGKNFIFRIIVEIILGLYLLLALKEPKYRPRSSSVLWAVGAFVLWIGVSAISSVDPIKSFWSNFERMEGYIGLLHVAAYFLIASTVLTAENLWTRFLQTSVGLSVLMGLYGILQLRGYIGIDQGSSRLDGTLGNAAYMAIYELFNIFFALFLLAREWKTQSMRWIYGIAIALNTFILFYTQTRGTVLGLVAGLLAAAVYLIIVTKNSHEKEWKMLRKIAAIMLGSIAVILVLFFAVRQIPAVQQSSAFGRLATISLNDKTTASRLMIWQMAYDGFKEKPLFGWGQENFSYVFNKYYNPAMYDQEQWFDRAHNAFLDWMTAAGAPGILLFISLFLAAAFAIMRASQLSLAERAILLGLLVGYAVHDMFVFDDLISYLQFFTVLALAHGLSQREVPTRAWLARPLSDEGIAVAAPLIIIATACAVFYINVGGIKNAMGLVNAIQPPSSAAALSGNLAQFKALRSGASLGQQEIAEQSVEFALQINQAPSVSPDIKQQFYSMAHDVIHNITDARKGDARLELFYGVLLDGSGQYAEARPQLVKALNDSSKKQQIYFELAMNNLIPSGDVVNATALLGEAFNSEPKYDTSRIYYVAALYLSGDNAKADSLLVERLSNASADEASSVNDRLLQSLIVTKQFKRAEAMLETRVTKDPNDSQTWLRYASMYYASGDKNGAIAVLSRAAKMNPAFADQANSLIAQLRAGK